VLLATLVISVFTGVIFRNFARALPVRPAIAPGWQSLKRGHREGLRGGPQERRASRSGLVVAQNFGCRFLLLICAGNCFMLRSVMSAAAKINPGFNLT